MTAQSQVLKIRRPDDWHIHLRDDDMLKTCHHRRGGYRLPPAHYGRRADRA